MRGSWSAMRKSPRPRRRKRCRQRQTPMLLVQRRRMQTPGNQSNQPVQAVGAPCRTVYSSADGKIANTHRVPPAVEHRRASRRTACRFPDDPRTAAQGRRLGAGALAAVAGGGGGPSSRRRLAPSFARLRGRRRPGPGAHRVLGLRAGPANPSRRELGRPGRQGVRHAALLRRLLQHPALELRHRHRSRPLPSALPRRHPAGRLPDGTAAQGATAAAR